METPASVMLSPEASTSEPELDTDEHALGSQTLVQGTLVAMGRRPLAPNERPGTLLMTMWLPRQGPQAWPSQVDRPIEHVT